MKAIHTLIILTVLLLVAISALSPVAVAGNFETGMERFKNRQFEEALQYFEAAEVADPDNLDIQYYRANTLLYLDRKIEAIGIFHIIVNTDPYSNAGHLSQVALNRLKALEKSEKRVQTGMAKKTNLTSMQITDWIVGSQDYPSLKAALASAKDYFHRVEEFNVYFRWPQKAMPLKIFIDQDERVEEHQYDYVDYALDQWAQAAGHEHISYKKVGDEGDADIIIVWNETASHYDAISHQKEYLAGVTRNTTSEETEEEGNYTVQNLKASRITIGLNSEITGKPFTDRQIYSTIIHEIGHALGLRHSDEETDIMYKKIHAKTRPRLTDRDVNTIVRMYKN